MAYTWNPLDKSANVTLSNGNLTASTSSGLGGVRATSSKTANKWYWEIEVTTVQSGTGTSIGIGTALANLSQIIGYDLYGWGWQSNGFYRHNNIYVSAGVSLVNGDIAQIALDLDNGKLWFGKNGTWNGSGNPATGANPVYSGVSGTLFPMCMGQNVASMTANFGASAFSYTVPAGFTGIGDESVIITPDPLAASPGLSGSMQLALPSSELIVAPALSLTEILNGWFLSPDPLAASPDLSAGLRVDLAVPELAASPGLSGLMQLSLPSAELIAAPELSITEVLLGWYLFPDPLAASPDLSAGLRVDLAVPELAAAAALSGGLLVSIPADLGVVAEMSVVALSSFGSSDFVITYLCRLTPRAGSAFSEIILPMSSFQGRFKSGDPSFLSVVVPGGDYAQAISDRNDPDDPPELSVYMVKTFVNGNVISERLMAVDLEDVRIYEGATNVSIELEGHRTVSYSPKAVTLSGASYKNYSAGKLRYRCEPDLYLRPGDVVTVDGETFTADNISIAMAVNAQTMEVAES